jgi:hypothetical protein
MSANDMPGKCPVEPCIGPIGSYIRPAGFGPGKTPKPLTPATFGGSGGGKSTLVLPSPIPNGPSSPPSGTGSVVDSEPAVPSNGYGSGTGGSHQGHNTPPGVPQPPHSHDHTTPSGDGGHNRAKDENHGTSGITQAPQGYPPYSSSQAPTIEATTVHAQTQTQVIWHKAPCISTRSPGSSSSHVTQHPHQDVPKDTPRMDNHGESYVPTRAPTKAPTQTHHDGENYQPTQATTVAPTQAHHEGESHQPTQASTQTAQMQYQDESYQPTQASTQTRLLHSEGESYQPTQAATHKPTDGNSDEYPHAPSQAPTEAAITTKCKGAHADSRVGVRPDA